MRSTDCRSDAFDLSLRQRHAHTRTHGTRRESREERTALYCTALHCTWTRSGFDSLHARRGTGDATLPVVSHAGCRFPNACTQLNSWHSRQCLRVKSNSFHQEAAHITPNPLKRRVGVTTVWYTSGPNRKICKDLIRRKSGNCSNQHGFFFFLSGWNRSTRRLIQPVHLWPYSI